HLQLAYRVLPAALQSGQGLRVIRSERPSSLVRRHPRRTQPNTTHPLPGTGHHSDQGRRSYLPETQPAFHTWPECLHFPLTNPLRWPIPSHFDELFFEMLLSVAVFSF